MQPFFKSKVRNSQRWYLLGRTPRRFLCCCSFLMLCIFIYLHLSMLFILLLYLHLISRLLCHVTCTPPWLLWPVKASTSSELYPQLLLIAFSFSSTASTTDLSGRFLPTGVFYLTLFPDNFGTTCFYQGFPGSWQLFLEICRASY